jgi:soluble lytic murein transglycosylase
MGGIMMKRAVLTVFAVLLLIAPVHAQQVAFTPTPTLASPLDAADASLHIGDYAQALANYTAATANSATSCDALYGIGVVYRRMEMYIEAADAFTRQIDACGASFRPVFLRGDVRQSAGDIAGAQADYEQALTLAPGLIDSYIYQRIAAVNPDASVLYLRLAAEAGREPQGEYVLRSELAQVYSVIGRPDEALGQYNAMLSRNLLSPEGQRDDIAAIEVQIANLEIALGNAQAGYARLQRVMADYTDEPAAFDALVALVTAEQSVDTLLRMRINVANENYQPVVSVLTSTLAAPPEELSAALPELYLLLGQARRGLGDSASAQTTFQTLRDQFPAAPEAVLAAVEQARTYIGTGETLNAINAYITVASAYPASPEAPDSVLRAARLLREAGDAAQAVNYYDQLGQLFPGTEAAEIGSFEAARLLQAAGDSQRAAAFYARSGSSHALLWQGKVLSAIGDVAGAQTAWQNAVNADPGTFFSQRACALLNNTPAYEPSTNIRLSEPTQQDIADAEAWLSQLIGAPVSAALPPELAANPLLVRGTELWALGLWREANAEFIALHRQLRNDPVAMFQLTSYYRGIRAYRASIISGIRVVVLSGVPIPEIPSYIVRQAYPIYFPDLVLNWSREFELDPLYVASLIRQESSYDVTAFSGAGARGLMQLMPPTAQDVADRLGLTNYQLSDLYRPMMNVQMGSFYLGSTRDFLGGDVVGALLGYNAGPGRAAGWTESAQGDIDLLYETIPFEETQLYLDITYENFSVYREIYGDGMPDCFFVVTPPATTQGA